VSVDLSAVTPAIRAALAALGIERLALGVHDASFPSASDEDVGRGSPYGAGARELIGLAAALGFDTLQLGPQGETSFVNPSPYDGAHLTKSILSIALRTLAEDEPWADLAQGLLPPLVAARPPGPPDRVQYEHAYAAAHEALRALHARFAAHAGGTLSARYNEFRARHAERLRADGLYEAASAAHGTDDWRRWPEGGEEVGDRALVERHLFGQFVLAEQHAALRASAGGRGVALFGDLQIGHSPRDLWRLRALLRADYVMGAPPSRTNPAGQAWGYPILDRAGNPREALAAVLARVDSLLTDFDGLRIDHPHGLVCPWVYRADDPDPAAAVGRGARLTCSPGLADHPALGALAIARPEQLSTDPGIARYADDWVRALDDEQVDRYGFFFDALMARLGTAGRRREDVVCEVLSTWPYPLRRVMERHGLGRFCVTQKADLARADDVYRSENASARDWIMVGNHDTPPAWPLAEQWHGTAVGHERALHLAKRLSPSESRRPRLARWIAADARHLTQAMLAELFVGPARRVSVFFADWLGVRDIYNRPGLVHPDNWRLRIPTSFADDYLAHVARGEAFNPPLALALALAAQPASAVTAELAPRLLVAARVLEPTLDEELASLLAPPVG
jgi:4-alpha-glucanotransferase